VLDVVESRRRLTELAGGREISADTLLTDFGFTGDKLTARVADLSGGERRRLQFLRLLLDEPNVLLLDEPTNDLDIDTLTVIEDYLDGWPGTLIVVTHDRYFLERVSDVTYALTGGGRCDLLPAASSSIWPTGPRLLPAASARRAARGSESARRASDGRQGDGPHRGPAGKLDDQIAALHESMAEAASDHRAARASSMPTARAAGAQGISRRSVAGGRRGVMRPECPERRGMVQMPASDRQSRWWEPLCRLASFGRWLLYICVKFQAAGLRCARAM
jgi:energy-coupling factor transporter ATP-binding protein EcfA2